MRNNLEDVSRKGRNGGKGKDPGSSIDKYLEQLTYLIFLKMSDEYSRPPYNRKVGVPPRFKWTVMRPLKGAELEVHYVEALRELGHQKGMLGQIFTKAQNKITDPAKLARLIEMVDSVSQTVDYVLANPPFGKKSSMTFTNEEGEQEKDDLTYNRQDFWATTSNKQLNFLQHIRAQLKTTGRAAVVMPDNVLFEGGAGETVRKKLMETAELHTILRLPTGIFYAQGVKANVLFFDNRPASKQVATKDVWYYDYRTNIHHTLKRNSLRLENLREFITCYNPENRHKRKETWHAEKNSTGRWRKYTYRELIARDKASLDLFWLKDESLTDLDNLPEPSVLADEIIENIEAGLANFRAVATSLAKC